MNTNDTESFRSETLPDVRLLQTAILYLITRYTLRPCSGLACTIVHRLQMLPAHPDLAGCPELDNIHRELLQHWQRIATQPSATCSSETFSSWAVKH